MTCYGLCFTVLRCDVILRRIAALRCTFSLYLFLVCRLVCVDSLYALVWCFYTYLYLCSYTLSLHRAIQFFYLLLLRYSNILLRLCCCLSFVVHNIGRNTLLYEPLSESTPPDPITPTSNTI